MATDQRETSGICWHMPDELRGYLLGPDGLRLREWLRDGRATVVKDSPHRAVYRVRLSGLDCHIKHNRLNGLRSYARELFRPIKAKREYELATTLLSRGVPVPTPLAWGVEGRVKPCASWLITETLDNGQTLQFYLETTLGTLSLAQRDRVRQNLARVLGTFLARMHAAGVVHHDLHPGNLLVRLVADDVPHFWLIDLHTVTAGRACPWRVCRANLAAFNRYFSLRASRADRLRFWQAYSHVLETVIPEPRGQMARMVEHLTDQSNQRFWCARDQRCMTTNRYYRTLTTPSVRGHVVRDLASGDLAGLVSNPDGPFERADAHFLKNSRSSTVVEFDFPVSGILRRVIYKRFRLTDSHGSWLDVVRRSTALRSWFFGHGLCERRLPTPRPLAVFHRTRFGLPREGYLLTQKLENAIDLHAFMDGLAGQRSVERTPELRRRAEVLARLLKQLHCRGLSHRDLKASNLLTSATPGDARIWFIDLVGVRRHRRLGRQRKYQNLARLHASFVRHPLVSRSEKLRFLRSYLEWGLRGKSGWKEWWRAIDAATQAKVARNLRNDRPLT